MTAQTQFTQFSTDCKVGEDGSLHLIGAFAVRADIAPSADELDQTDVPRKFNPIIYVKSLRSTSWEKTIAEKRAH